MRPSFEQLKKDVDYQEDILKIIVEQLSSSYFETYSEYQKYKESKEKEKFLFTLHKLLNNIGLLDIPDELKICRDYYYNFQMQNFFYTNPQVEEIFKNVNDFLNKNNNIFNPNKM